jgi:uncharacterized protein
MPGDRTEVMEAAAAPVRPADHRAEAEGEGAVAAEASDRFGLGWRPQLAAGILANLDSIDIVEVIADDYFDAASKHQRALATLAAQVPIALHGIGMGLASTCRPDQKRIDAMARLVEKIQPESWSEHLAFVRAGEIEIGHLAAVPRNAGTVDSTAANLERAVKTIGGIPLMENIATLIDPPGSPLDEPQWISGVAAASGCGLLLDLQNVFANCMNFGADPFAFLDRIPLHRVAVVHLAGGVWMDNGQLLDDHLHDVPDQVYALLRHLAMRVSQPLTIVLERDGNYPTMTDLLAQLDHARQVVRDGRRLAAA